MKDPLLDSLKSRLEEHGMSADEGVERLEMVLNSMKDDDPERGMALSSFGFMLIIRYEQTENIADLNRAIEVGETAIQATPMKHTDRPGVLTNLTIWLGLRLEQTNAMDVLDRIVKLARMAFEEAMPEDQESMSENLRMWLIKKYERTQDLEDLCQIIDVVEFATGDNPDLGPPNQLVDMVADWANHIDFSETDFGPGMNGWGRLGMWLLIRFKETDSVDYLNRAIKVLRLVSLATAIELSALSTILHGLSLAYGRRYEKTGVIEDLRQAIQVVESALGIVSPDDQNKPSLLNNYGAWQALCFKQSEKLEDLSQAITTLEAAVEAAPADFSKQVDLFGNLGGLLILRYANTEELHDLDRAIELTNTGLSLVPVDHPERHVLLGNLGIWCHVQFKRTNDPADLDRAIESLAAAVKLAPNDPDRSRLGEYLDFLEERYSLTASAKDLNSAIDVIDTALKSSSLDEKSRARRLFELGLWLSRRYEHLGAISDLPRAIEASNLALKAMPPDSPNRPRTMNNLASLLSRRFERQGKMEDLDKAIEYFNTALMSDGFDNVVRSGMLNNLGSVLDLRFQHSGAIDDINWAIHVTEMAEKGLPNNHPTKCAVLSNLGIRLSRRYIYTKDENDLDRAIEMAERALEIAPPEHPHRIVFMVNLCNRLSLRYSLKGSIVDLNRAIELARSAAEIVGEGHPYRYGVLNDAGRCLGLRYAHTNDLRDIEKAIQLTSMALAAARPGDQARANILSNLGHLYYTRFKRTLSIEDRDQCVAIFKEGWNCQDAPPSIRIGMARAAADFFLLDRNWADSSTYFQNAVELLPSISPLSLKHSDQQSNLSQFSGLSSSAATTAINAGKSAYEALKLLELGRGVIAGLLLGLRTDLSELDAEDHDLAEEFLNLRNKLDTPMEAGGSLLTTVEDVRAVEALVQQRRTAEDKFKKIIVQIRSKKGFETFLLPLSAEEINAAAEPGHIVVINVSFIGCEAFLIRHDQPVEALKLEKLNLSDIENHVKSLKTADPVRVHQTLGWLWDVAASPILVALGFTAPPPNDDWHHIWWIPTGPLSHLPFHAAGRHLQGNNCTVLDRVVSSYSSSIKALMYGRRHASKSRLQSSENALLITVPGSGLPFAVQEVELLEELCSSLKLKPVKPRAHRDEILQHLSNCRIFHFASHGHSNPNDPSDSSLVLGNEKVTVADLRDCKLQEKSPFLAYLSACSTKVNDFTRLMDEDIHLVSACQLAGFRHVIGTLWEVSDRYSVDIARVLYETMKTDGMNDVAVYRGLHSAVKTLRDKFISEVQVVVELQSNKGKRSEHDTASLQEREEQFEEIISGLRALPQSIANAVRTAGGRGGLNFEMGNESGIRGTDADGSTEDNRKRDGNEKESSSVGSGLRQSIWDDADASPKPNQTSQRHSNPLIWAAYIHTGV